MNRLFLRCVPCRVLAAAALVASWAASAQADATRWWRREWAHCRTFEVPAEAAASADAFVFEFHNGGFTQDDAADVRVIGRRGEAGVWILSHDQGGLTRVAAELQPGATRYDVYYGNPAAQPPPGDWRPQTGLWLETRPYHDRRMPPNWIQAERLLEETKANVHGRGPVDRVFHGHNPFGPSGRSISIYTGYLHIAEPGIYSFASTSDGAFFLKIEGRLLIERGGRQWARPQARHREEIRLGRGRRRFEFVVISNHPIRQRAVAAWRKPGAPEDKYEVIPPEAFVPVPQASPVAYRVFNSRVAPDFAFENLDEIHLESTVLVRCRFADTSGLRTAQEFRRSWDFGDGLKGEGAVVEHVYFRPARRTVTLTLTDGNEEHGVSHAVRSEQNWARQADRSMRPDRAAYEKAVDAMALGDLRPADLVAAGEAFRDLEMPERLLAVCRAMARRAGDLNDRQLAAASGLALLAFAEAEARPGEATAAFLRLEGAARANSAKGKIAADLAEHLIHFGEAFRAQTQAERALRDYQDGLSARDARRTRIALGDAHFDLGREAEAREEYERALAIPIAEVERRTPERRLVHVGALTRAVEDFLIQDRPDAALELLDQLEWEIPTARLDGYSRILRARALQAQGRLKLAAALMERLVAAMPRNTFADDALILAAETYMEQDPPKRQEAIRALEKLVANYPESALLEKAKEMVEGLKED